MGDLWEEQAQFGYRTGISLALHMPNGKHFMIGVDRDQPLPQDCGELTRMVADLQLFAVHANEAASRVLLTAGTGQRELHENLECLLSPREKECLKWTLEGKTAWEIGMILSISDRTVAQHLGRSMQKLDAVGKHQAALRAQRLGWI
jgi:DNA-binding CsgD family transcriptional regulator